MEIKPEEVKQIKTIGSLHGDEVKLILTKGGFNVAVGRRNKNSKKVEALAAGSHAALVNHQLTKQFKNSFEPVLAKSESEQMEKVEDKSNLLPAEISDKGIELYILSKSNKLDFVVYKHGITLGEYNTEVCNNTLNIKFMMEN